MGGVDSGVRLTVVVLNFRTPEEAATAVESSRAAAAGIHAETIIVDNASHDGSVERLRRQCPEASIIEMYANLGFAAGMNAGLRASRCEFVLLLNSDIVARPGSVAALVDYMRAHSDAGVCAPLLVDENGRPSRTLLLRPTAARVLFPWVGKSAYRRWQHRLGTQPMEVEATEGAAVMVRRSAFEQAGLLDEDFFFYHEIVEWCMRIRDAGWRCVVVPAAEMVHACGGSTGGVRRAARVELKRSEYQLLRKRLGAGVYAATLTRDAVSVTLSVCFYGVLTALSLGCWRRGLDKFRVHSAVWLWLALGMPHRLDKRYERLFGRWD